MAGFDEYTILAKPTFPPPPAAQPIAPGMSICDRREDAVRRQRLEHETGLAERDNQLAVGSVPLFLRVYRYLACRNSLPGKIVQSPM